jgi:hypothetical protein
MPVIFTREICMPEVNTEFLFTIALEIQVFSLGDTPMAADASFILTAAASKDRSLRVGCCPAAAARR